MRFFKPLSAFCKQRVSEVRVYQDEGSVTLRDFRSNLPRNAVEGRVAGELHR